MDKKFLEEAKSILGTYEMSASLRRTIYDNLPHLSAIYLRETGSITIDRFINFLSQSYGIRKNS